MKRNANSYKTSILIGNSDALQDKLLKIKAEWMEISTKEKQKKNNDKEVWSALHLWLSAQQRSH